MKISRLTKILIIVCSFVFLTGVLTKRVFAAAQISLNPNNATVSKNSQFVLEIKIDTEGVKTFGAEAIIGYPTADLDVVEITDGDFYTDFSQANDEPKGTIEIRSFMSSPFESKSGAGILAKIKFVNKKDSGTGTVGFTCGEGANTTQILDSNGNNILSCSSLNETKLTYSAQDSGGNGGSGTNPTATPKPTIKPTSPPAGGPTTKPKITSSPSPSPNSSPEVSVKDSTSDKVDEQNEREKITRFPLWIIGIGAVLLSGTIFFVLKALKKEREEEPPQITPSTTDSFNQTVENEKPTQTLEQTPNT